jgi:hypothetical protein
MKGAARFVLSGAILAFVMLAPLANAKGAKKQEFAVPVQFWTEHEFHPAGYLERVRVPDVSKRLADEHKRELVQLFRAAEYACRFKYRQTYPIDTSIPAYRLLKRQFPKLSSIESESGRVVLLSRIVEYLEGPAGLEEAERSFKEALLTAQAVATPRVAAPRARAVRAYRR